MDAIIIIINMSQTSTHAQYIVTSYAVNEYDYNSYSYNYNYHSPCSYAMTARLHKTILTKDNWNASSYCFLVVKDSVFAIKLKDNVYRLML